MYESREMSLLLFVSLYLSINHEDVTILVAENVSWNMAICGFEFFSNDQTYGNKCMQ